MKIKSILFYTLFIAGIAAFVVFWALGANNQVKANGLESHVVYLPMVLNQSSTTTSEPEVPTTPSPPPTPVPPTSTPPAGGPTAAASLVCDTPTSLMLTIQGENWSGSNISFFWNGVIQGQMHPPVHGSIQATYRHHQPINGAHIVRVENNVAVKEFSFTINCLEVSEPTEPTPEPTPAPLPDLVISQPELLTGEANLFETSVTIAVSVTNNSDITLYNMIFVDLFINPTEIYEDKIPLAESDAFIMLTSIAAGETRLISFTFEDGLPTDVEEVYAMVDTAQTIDEAIETNNVSEPLELQ